MSDVKVALANIIDKVPNTYNTNERWVVKKIKSKYAHKLLQFCPLSILKNKLQYFSNKFAMMISKVDHGKSINWATIMYYQLVKKLIKWEKCQKNMRE